VVSLGGADTSIGGSVSDGGGIARMTALLSTPGDQFLVEDVAIDGDTWRYLPQLTKAGEYLLILVAWDRAGNATTTSAFNVLVSGEDAVNTELYLPLIQRGGSKQPAEGGQNEIYLPLITWGIDGDTSLRSGDDLDDDAAEILSDFRMWLPLVNEEGSQTYP